MEHINLPGFLAPICHYICKLMYVMNALFTFIAYFKCSGALRWCMFCIMWWITILNNNKVKLGDMIAATVLIILPKLNSNCPFVGAYDLQMTSQNNRAPIQSHVKLCVSFHAIVQFKQELQPGNAQTSVFCPAWPWNLMDGLENQ